MEMRELIAEEEAEEHQTPAPLLLPWCALSDNPGPLLNARVLEPRTRLHNRLWPPLLRPPLWIPLFPKCLTGLLLTTSALVGAQGGH